MLLTVSPFPILLVNYILLREVQFIYLGSTLFCSIFSKDFGEIELQISFGFGCMCHKQFFSTLAIGTFLQPSGIITLLYTPRCNSSNTIARPFDLGISIKILAGTSQTK